MEKIVIATRNNKKRKELNSLLKGLNIKIISLNEFKNAPEVTEDGKTFKENAVKKALIISRCTKLLTIADDSGLEVKALRGKPGVKSSRFAGDAGNDKKNMKKLLRLLKNVPKGKRGARFVCSIAIAKSGKLLKVIRGICSGRIAFEPRGSYGFGYDPVFIAPKYKKTFAELGPGIKNKISHRSRALAGAKAFIEIYLQKYS